MTTTLRAAAIIAAMTLLACASESKNVSGPSTGEVDVNGTTVGADDPGGYLLSLDGGSPIAVPTTIAQHFPGVPAGSHTAALTGLGGNCTATPNQLSGSLAVGGVLALDVTVQCAPRQVVYASGNHGDARIHIYTIMTDGTGITGPLHAGLGDDRAPARSPDGSTIAFMSSRSGSWQIWIMGQDGSGLHLLTSGTQNVSPTWSADGTKLAYQHTAFGSGEVRANIEILDLTSGHVTDLPNGGAIDGEPDWSPDGTKIVFMSIAAGQSKTQIWVMNAIDGTGRVRLTNDGAQDYSPSWSPMGDKIAFLSDRTGSSGGENVYVMNPDGTAQTALSNEPGVTFGRPHWTPDGLKIITCTNRADPATQSFALEFLFTRKSGYDDFAPRSAAIDLDPDMGR